MRDLQKLDKFELRLRNISVIQECLSFHGMKSFVIDGALLGIIREGSLIKWDWDVEIAVLDSQFNLPAFESVFSALMFEGLKIRNLNLKKFPKFNLIMQSDPQFTYSLIILRTQRKYCIRPRYRYPRLFFAEDPIVCRVSGYEVSLPNRYIEFLEFVYGPNWITPIDSKHVRSYLNRSVFRWGYFDWLHRILMKWNFIPFLLTRIIFSEMLNSREPILNYILSQKSVPRCDLVEIGSSDGKESISFLLSENTRKSTIYEPRISAISAITSRLGFRKVAKRLDIQNKLVVADKYDSTRFKELEKGHLSHILQSEKHLISQDNVVHPILFSEVLEAKGSRPLLVKMDLEGYEISLIRNFIDDLAINFPISFLLELHQRAYDKNEVSKILVRLLQLGFSIECFETASYPRPSLLLSEFVSKPLIINSRRALYVPSHAERSSHQLFEKIFGEFFVCNPKTSEFGYRLVRTVLISKGINFQIKGSKSIRSLFWRIYYGF